MEKKSLHPNIGEGHIEDNLEDLHYYDPLTGRQPEDSIGDRDNFKHENKTK